MFTQVLAVVSSRRGGMMTGEGSGFSLDLRNLWFRWLIEVCNKPELLPYFKKETIQCAVKSKERLQVLA